MQRCPWSESFDLYRQYHDLEWGVPLRDDRALFGLLLLEGAQAGLSWATILKKRENYRRAFADFDPALALRFVGIMRRTAKTSEQIDSPMNNNFSQTGA